jgi:hypothetical protein
MAVVGIEFDGTETAPVTVRPELAVRSPVKVAPVKEA